MIQDASQDNPKGEAQQWEIFIHCMVMFDPEMVSIVDPSLVKSIELYTEDDIMVFPYQTENALVIQWHEVSHT